MVKRLSVEIEGKRVCYVKVGSGPNVLLFIPGSVGKVLTFDHHQQCFNSNHKFINEMGSIFSLSWIQSMYNICSSNTSLNDA